MTGGVGGGRLYRVRWTPGSDDLLGICHCGAEKILADPAAVWDWLLAHPQGHDGASSDPPQRHSPLGTDGAAAPAWTDRPSL
jgi:hypothetical protein